MKRKPIVGMSLKIYINTMEKASDLARQVSERFRDMEGMDVFLIPSMGTIYPVAQILKGTGILYGVQNIAPLENGAMTGELSVESAVDLGCHLVELGHAERKRIFREDYAMINEKILLTLKNGLMPVICIGETEKGPGRKEELKAQIRSLLTGVAPEAYDRIVLAYEPEWAIGQDKPAEAVYVHESLRFIREILHAEYGETAGSVMRIIYGGSANKENARELVSSEDVDGLFIGRFGHDVDNFESIVNHVKSMKEETEDENSNRMR